MTKINWDEAPKGAQRYHAALHRPWLRKDSGENGGIYWWSQIFNGWIAYGGNAEGLRSFNEATPRPSEHLPLFQTEQGEEIERLKAELVEATEMALGQAKKLIEKDKRIAELEAEALEFRNLHSAFTCALQEASSLASSVSVSRSRKCEIDGETFYMQTDDWCKRAVEEVAPLTRIALNSARLRQGEK